MIRALVADDSSFMRKALTHILESDRDIKVIDTASNGEEAVRKVKELCPDIVLLDIEMPLMDGFCALTHIMTEAPTPVVVISGLKEPALAVKSLIQGAVDFIPKPSGVISYGIEELKEEIIARVKTAASVNVQKMKLISPGESYVKSPKKFKPKQAVIIGASTGGPRAIAAVLSSFPPDISAAVIVVLHMGHEFIPPFVDLLKWKCPLDISIVKHDNIIRSGKVFLSPGGCNISIVQDKGVKRFNIQKNKRYSVPSIDITMRSAAKIYGENAVGVLLTGMGSDGASGLKAIKDAGGTTIAEDESTCVIFGMPKAAIGLGCVDEVLPLPQIAGAILRMI